MCPFCIQSSLIAANAPFLRCSATGIWVSEQQLADAAQLASLADETPEGRSIVILAKRRFNLRERDIDCNLNFITGEARRGRVRMTLSNSFGFGGSNSCIVMRHPDLT